ncbi:pesticin C-terminus-like muramidase [Asaia sp. HN010]|uniref:pesticin C-terminus-like muramidase n=1 Tax=Asaia sp. HN010 TaxID=3081233 RepID=UPI003017D686
MIGGGGLTPGQAAEYAVRLWMGKGPEWVQQILGVTLPPQTMEDFARVIEGAVHKHGESPAESIQRQRYNIASSEHGEQVRNAISREFYDRNLTPAENKALAVQLADGTKTLAQFRREAAYSDVARHKIADIFRQEHGFDATQQDLDYASMKTGDGWSLQDYRWSEAHSDRVTSKLKEIITAVQGRPVNANDDVFIRAQQDSLGNGQQSIDQVRQSLARWTADNGGYDAVFQATHNTSMQGSDRDYAADQMGNGRSVQEYRWSEAHGDRGRQESSQLFHNVTGYDGNANEIKFLQDKIGNGTSYQDTCRDLAYSQYGRDSVTRILQRLDIQTPTQFQYDCFQGLLAEQKDSEAVYRQAAKGWEGEYAAQKLTDSILGRAATVDEAHRLQNEMASGRNITDLRYEIVHSLEATTKLQALAQTVYGRDFTESEMMANQKQMVAGKSLRDIRWEIAHSQEARGGIADLSHLISGKLPTDIEVAAQQQMLGTDVGWDALRKAQIYSVQACNYLASIHKDAFQTDITASDLARYQDDLVHHRDVYGEILEFITPKAPQAHQRDQWTYVNEDGPHGIALDGYVPKKNNFVKDPATGHTVNHPGPNVHSGVTIGHGIDLGQFLKNELKTMGIPDFLLKKLPDELFASQPGSKGLLGQAAQDWLNKNELKLSRYEAEFISAKVYEHHSNIIIGVYEDKYGAKSFSKLNTNLQAVIIDLGFRMGARYLNNPFGVDLASKVHAGDLSGASEYIKSRDSHDNRYIINARKILEK